MHEHGFFPLLCEISGLRLSQGPIGEGTCGRAEVHPKLRADGQARLQSVAKEMSVMRVTNNLKQTTGRGSAICPATRFSIIED
jgi:hypothetical protein